MIRGEGRDFKRDSAPFSPSKLPRASLGMIKGESKRGEASLPKQTFPLSFEGEGDKGGEVGKIIAIVD